MLDAMDGVDDVMSGSGACRCREKVLKEAPKWRVSEQEAPKWQPSDRFFVLKDRHFLETELSETRENNRNFVVVFSFLANHCGASIFFATFRLL